MRFKFFFGDRASVFMTETESEGLSGLCSPSGSSSTASTLTTISCSPPATLLVVADVSTNPSAFVGTPVAAVLGQETQENYQQQHHLPQQSPRNPHCQESPLHIGQPEKALLPPRHQQQPQHLLSFPAYTRHGFYMHPHKHFVSFSGFTFSCVYIL